MRVTIDSLLKGAEKFAADADNVEHGMGEPPDEITVNLCLGASLMLATAAIAERLDRLTEAIEKHMHESRVRPKDL